MGQSRWIGYQTDTGRLVAREELEALPLPVQAALLQRMRAFLLLPRGQGAPGWVRKLKGSDVWELKANFDGDTFRVLFGDLGEQRGDRRRALAVLVFGKKSKKCPPKVIRTASRRLKDYKAQYPAGAPGNELDVWDVQEV
jgi:phage-related protein